MCQVMAMQMSPKRRRAAWGKMIETYLTNRDQLKAVLLIVDLRHPPTADDVMMYQFLKHYNLRCIIINTKADKIPKAKWQKHIKITKDKLDLDPEDQIILFSSETGYGKDKAWSVLQSYMD